MAHLTSAAVWTVDTAATGLISGYPVNLSSIIVTWKVSSAGSLLLQEYSGQTANPIIVAKTLGASTAAWDQMTQQFFFDRVFQNVWLTTATNIDTILIVTN